MFVRSIEMSPPTRVKAAGGNESVSCLKQLFHTNLAIALRKNVTDLNTFAFPLANLDRNSPWAHLHRTLVWLSIFEGQILAVKGSGPFDSTYFGAMVIENLRPAVWPRPNVTVGELRCVYRR